MADLLPPTTAMGGNNNRLLIGIAKLLEINTAGNPPEHGHKHTHMSFTPFLLEKFPCPGA